MGNNNTWDGTNNMTKQPYYNTFLQLRGWILEEINKVLGQLPKTIPCKVTEYKGQVVDVLPTVDIGVTAKTLSDIPVAKSKYYNIPLQPDDPGLLVPASYLYNDLILSDLGFINSPKESTTFSGYIFIPFVTASGDYVTEMTSTQIFSQGGKSNINMNEEQIKLSAVEEASTIEITESSINISAASEASVLALSEEEAKLSAASDASSITLTSDDIKLKTDEEILWSKLKLFLDNWQTSYNSDIAIIKAGLTALGYPGASGITGFNGSYR